jgi:hypothetical protein
MISFYKLWQLETNEYFQNTNVIVSGDFNLLLITDSDQDLLSSGGYYRMLASFCIFIVYMSSITLKMVMEKH